MLDGKAEEQHYTVTDPWENKMINVHRMLLFQGYTHLCFYVCGVKF